MALAKDPLNLIITGVGGQGNILASQITAAAGISQKLFASIGETYGASQRGGSVMSHVRFSCSFQYGPLIPEGEADVILGFEPLETLRVLVDFGNENTHVIFNDRPNYPIGVLTGQQKYPEMDVILGKIRELAASAKVVKATDLAQELGTLVAQNVVMVGALAASELLPIPEPAFEQTIAEIFEDPKKREFNLQAFRLGLRGFQQGQSL